MLLIRMNLRLSVWKERDLADAGIANFFNLAELVHIQTTTVQQESPHRPAVGHHDDLFAPMVSDKAVDSIAVRRL